MTSVLKSFILLYMGKGDYIRYIRHSLGLSQAQFAFMLGVSFPTINRYEQEKVRVPNHFILATQYLWDNRDNLASIVDLDYNDLFSDLYKDIKLCRTCKQPKPNHKQKKAAELINGLL